jgi:hypothetical protein
LAQSYQIDAEPNVSTLVVVIILFGILPTKLNGLHHPSALALLFALLALLHCPTSHCVALLCSCTILLSRTRLLSLANLVLTFVPCSQPVLLPA